MLVRLHRSLVAVQRRERVLVPIVVSVIVRIDGLRLETRDGIELLDARGTQARQCTEHRTLNLSNLGVLDRIDESLLSSLSVLRQLLSGVLLSERSDLVK